MERLITLHCPECREASLDCRVEVSQHALEVFLVSQSCECDPFGAWEDVWEQAREIVLEEGAYD